MLNPGRLFVPLADASPGAGEADPPVCHALVLLVRGSARRWVVVGVAAPLPPALPPPAPRLGLGEAPRDPGRDRDAAVAANILRALVVKLPIASDDWFCPLHLTQIPITSNSLVPKRHGLVPVLAHARECLFLHNGEWPSEVALLER